MALINTNDPVVALQKWAEKNGYFLVKIKTDKQILKETNNLAKELCLFEGYETPKNYKFYNNQSPRAMHFWNMACMVQELLNNTEVEGNVDIDEIERQEIIDMVKKEIHINNMKF